MLSALIVSEARMPSQDAAGNIPSKVPVMARAVVSPTAVAASVSVVSVVAASFSGCLCRRPCKPTRLLPRSDSFFHT